MASDRFVKFSEADVKAFSEKQENANTKNKTSYNLNYSKFLATFKWRGNAKIKDIPVAKLQEFH